MPTLVNITPVDVVYLDGKSETIQLPRLTIEQLYTWAKLMRDKETPSLVRLCTGRGSDWINTLEDASFAKLASKCVELNFSRAMTLSQSDPVMATIIGPLLADSVLTLSQMENASGGTLSGQSLERAPSTSAEATGTESSDSPPKDSKPSSSSPAESAPKTASPISQS